MTNDHIVSKMTLQPLTALYSELDEQFKTKQPKSIEKQGYKIVFNSMLPC